VTITAPVSAQGTNAGTGATTTVTVPAGATVGAQGLVVFMDGQGSSVDASDLTGKGWAPVVSLVLPTVMSVLVWGKKIVTADLGATLTITSTLSTSIKRTMVVAAYPGATLGDAQIKQAGSNSTSHMSPTATAANAGAWAVDIFAERGNPASSGFTLPGNLIMRQQFFHTGGAAISTVVADDDNVGAGTVAANTVTGTFATNNAIEATIILEPGSAANVPPNAVAGVNQFDVEPWAVVQVGGADSDTDGTISSVSWAQTGGPDVTLYSDAALATPSTTAATVYFEAPASVNGTTVTLEKTVTDNLGAVAVVDVAVQVLPVTERVVIAGVEVPLRILSAKS
jgi:hypothetical protein